MDFQNTWIWNPDVACTGGFLDWNAKRPKSQNHSCFPLYALAATLREPLIWWVFASFPTKDNFKYGEEDSRFCLQPHCLCVCVPQLESQRVPHSQTLSQRLCLLTARSPRLLDWQMPRPAHYRPVGFRGQTFHQRRICINHQQATLLRGKVFPLRRLAGNQF